VKEQNNKETNSSLDEDGYYKYNGSCPSLKTSGATLYLAVGAILVLVLVGSFFGWWV
tara:strand:+ start:1458 stop:1628 length:171 start_codon:yes stop_codon:yes gene_type:complete